MNEVKNAEKNAVSAKNLPMLLREANQNDLNFIYNSWSYTYRKSPIMYRMDVKLYFENQTKQMHRILKDSCVYIACDSEDPSHIFGYIVFEDLQNIAVIHYIYVKNSFRKNGIASYLLESVGINERPCVATHDTWYFPFLRDKYSGRLIYNPFLLMGGHYYDGY